MSTPIRAIPLILSLLAVAPLVSAATAPTSHTEATVTESPNRVVAENDSVRVVFDATVNYVPSELAFKRGSGRNLIVNNFCLYYQYVENGALRSVNEGYPGGQISNGRYTMEKKDGAAVVQVLLNNERDHGANAAPDSYGQRHEISRHVHHLRLP